MLPHWPTQIQSFILPWIVRRLTHPFTYIIRCIPCIYPVGVLSFSCNPHNQQNKRDSPLLHSCAYKVAPDFEGILAFHAGSALCTRYFWGWMMIFFGGGIELSSSKNHRTRTPTPLRWSAPSSTSLSCNSGITRLCEGWGVWLRFSQVRKMLK